MRKSAAKILKGRNVRQGAALLLAALLLAAPAQAQNADSRVRLNVRVLDGKTLYAPPPENKVVQLWGVEIVEPLKARMRLEELVGTGEVSCRFEKTVQNRIFVRCSSQATGDIGLSLLREGLAVADRSQTMLSPYQSDYEKAEAAARDDSAGAWGFIQKERSLASVYVPPWLDAWLPVLVPIAIVIGPLLGLFIIAFVQRQGLASLKKSQEREFEHARRHEASLRTREKLVLASALEGELMDNKSKLEAYIAIYRELLSSLKDPAKTPRYQQGGDLVHKHPALGRAIFDANADKLNLLDLKLASDISKLYVTFRSDAEYTNLDPSLPLETAVRMVEMVIQDAEKLMPKIDGLIERLSHEHAAPDRKSSGHHGNGDPQA